MSKNNKQQSRSEMPVARLNEHNIRNYQHDFEQFAQRQPEPPVIVDDVGGNATVTISVDSFAHLVADHTLLECCRKVLRYREYCADELRAILGVKKGDLA